MKYMAIILSNRRAVDDYDIFDTIDEAISWAEEQLKDSIEYGQDTSITAQVLQLVFKFKCETSVVKTPVSVPSPKIKK